jgi:hypothetical protein
MERNEAARRGRIALMVALVTVLCVLCALTAVLTRGGDRVAFNTARLVWAEEARRAWR